jgi:ribosomal protein S18 acetylase RimI-like enzyme
VLDTERLLGIGSRLVEAAKEDLSSIGVTRIEISVMAVNEAAMAFWSSHGFRAFRAHLSARIGDEHERGPTGSAKLPRRR